MKNYETPKIQITEFDAIDIVQTSTLADKGAVKVPAKGVVVPVPDQTSLDSTY